jgi:hypothetical protein
MQDEPPTMGWCLDGLATNRPAGLPCKSSSPATAAGWRCAALLTALLAVTIATSLPHAAEAGDVPPAEMSKASNPSSGRKPPPGQPRRPMPSPPPSSPQRRAPVNDPFPRVEEEPDYDDINVDNYDDDPDELDQVGGAACTTLLVIHVHTKPSHHLLYTTPHHLLTTPPLTHPHKYQAHTRTYLPPRALGA